MKEDIKVIATNSRAYHNYFILETYEAGIVLTGPEVKSVRAGNISIIDSYAIIKNNEAFLINTYIPPYQRAYSPEEARKTRKLLLHKQEINRLVGKIKTKGLTLIPLRVYIKKGLIKVEIALARGKKLYDKRKELKEKEIKRELESILKKMER